MATPFLRTPYCKSRSLHNLSEFWVPSPAHSRAGWASSYLRIVFLSVKKMISLCFKVMQISLKWSQDLVSRKKSPKPLPFWLLCILSQWSDDSFGFWCQPCASLRLPAYPPCPSAGSMPFFSVPGSTTSFSGIFASPRLSVSVSSKRKLYSTSLGAILKS